MWSSRGRRALLAFTLLALQPVLPTSAQDYPSRPITIVVSLAAGSGMDTLVRLYADQLAQSLAQPVIVDGRSTREVLWDVVGKVGFGIGDVEIVVDFVDQ